MNAVTLHNVFKSYGSLPVLENLSLTFPSGSICCLMSPSGTGKTLSASTSWRLLPMLFAWNIRIREPFPLKCPAVLPVLPPYSRRIGSARAFLPWKM